MKKQGIFNQINIGKQWGIFAQVASQLSILVSIVSLFLVSITAYTTTLAGWLEDYGISIGMFGFVAIIMCLLVVAFILLYKFALPSFFSYWNDQFYRHDNPMRKEIEEMGRKLDKLLVKKAKKKRQR